MGANDNKDALPLVRRGLLAKYLSWGQMIQQRALPLVRRGLLAKYLAGVSVTTECLSGRKLLIYYGLVAMTFTVQHPLFSVKNEPNLGWLLKITNLPLQVQSP